MFGYQIDQHVPLAAVGSGIEEQEGHQSSVNLLAPLRSLHDVVEEVVAPLDLVPVEEEGLRELELVQVVVLHEGQADAVEGREQPATAGAALIGHRLALRLHLVVEHMVGRLQCLAGQTHIEGIHPGADVLGQQVLRLAVEVAPPLGEQFIGDGTRAGTGHRACRVLGTAGGIVVATTTTAATASSSSAAAAATRAAVVVS